MSDENKKDDPRVQADNNGIAVGNLSVGGSVDGTIIIGNHNTVNNFIITEEQVVEISTRLSTQYQPKPFDGRCPYKGLDVFEEEDAELFFGREKLVDDLVSRVKDSRTVFVTGPSGSGKSSLVRAGLIHALKQAAIKGSERWLYATMKPGRDPIGELGRVASSLAGSTNAEDEIRAKAMEDATIFARWCEIALKDGRDKRVVLFIDQFEEVFTQISKEKEEERIVFLNLLTYAATVENGRVIILFSMRSDFISNCATYPQLNELLNSQFKQIGAMQPEELVSAIAQPALRVGLRIDPDLIAQVINDMKGEPGALPLMQFAMKDLFDFVQAKGGVVQLTLNDYLQRGGNPKSLERHADAAFAGLSMHEQELARSIFSGLIEIGYGVQDTKRTALFDELIPASAKADEIEAIVQKLADARLVTTNEAAGKDTVTISHEKLIDAWPWLKRLINENRDVISLQNEITEAAEEWEEHKRDASYLYSGARLSNTQEQLKANKLTLTETASEFVQAGFAQQKRVQLVRIGGIAGFIGLIIAGIIFFSYLSTANAQKLAEQSSNAVKTQVVIANTAQAASTFAVAQQATAQANAQISRAGELAAQSVSLRDKNFLISLLLAVEAFKGTNEQITSVQAQSALLENTQANPMLDQFLSGDTGPVVSAIFSPDGKILASGTYGHDILLWDVKTRQPMDRLIGHTDIIRSIAFNRDGSMMASGSEDQTIILWDMKTGHPIRTMSRHSNAVTSVAFSLDGKMLASGSEDATVMLWDVETGAFLYSLSEHSTIVRSVAFSPDGKILASASDDGTIILWDVKTGKSVDKPLNGHKDPLFNVPKPVFNVAFSPDGTILASGSSDKNVILWDVKTRQPINKLSRHSATVRTLAFSPDGKMLASGSEDTTIILWNVETCQLFDQLRGHSALINSVSFSPDGNTLASGSGDSSIILWDMNPRQLISQSFEEKHEGPVYSVAFSPDGKMLASGSEDTTIMLWDVETLRRIGQPLKGHSENVKSVAFSPDGKTLASGSGDTNIMLWDVEKRQTIDPSLRGHTDPVTSVAFSPDGKTLASGSEDTTIILWDLKTHQPISEPLRGHTRGVTSVAFSPDGKTLASGSEDTIVSLWDVEKGRVIFALTGHLYRINSLAFSPDGSMLASGSYDGSLILWDVKKGQAIVTWSGSSYSINSLSFSPDGKTLALGSDDQTVVLWDVRTHQSILSLSGQSAPVQSVAFSPDGKTLASSSFNIILWDLNEKSWINESCERVGRNFTPTEWGLYFSSEEFRKTCPEFPLEPSATPTATP